MCQGDSQARTKGKGQMPRHTPRVQGWRIDRPPAGNSTEGQGEEGQGKGTALITGRPWGPVSSVSHSGAERWLSPSVTGGHTPQAAKEQQGKRPATAKTRALLTGRSPSTKTAWSPKAAGNVQFQCDYRPANREVLCPECLSLSPPHWRASASSSSSLLTPRSQRRFFFLWQQILKYEARHH